MPTQWALMEVGKCWADESTKHKVMDVELSLVFAARLDAVVEENYAEIDRLKAALFDIATSSANGNYAVERAKDALARSGL